MSYTTKVYKDQNGDRMVVASGGTLQVDGVLSVGGSNQPATVTLAAAAGSTNISNVTITVKDGAAATIAGVFNLDIWLSDSSVGQGLTVTSASGTVQAKASSGTDLQVYSAKKALRVQTKSTGVYILEITDSAKTGFYVCAQVPGTGKTVVSSQLVTGSYG